MNLSKRLKTIASFVKEDAYLLDVGCDHALLDIYLILNKPNIKAIASDINEKPLASAKSNIERLGADGVRLVLCDGLAGVTRDDADTVIIAGMGGEVISGIISRAEFLRDNTVSLVLQPTTAAKELRQFLAQNGFRVERETAIAENGKIYSVMAVRFSGAPYDISDVQSLIGILTPTDDDAIAYIQKQYRIAQKCADQLKCAANKQDEYNYYLSLSEKLKNILGG